MSRRVAPLLLALVLAASAGAETVRSEGLGTAALPGAPGAAPRALALDAALADAVEEVARGLAPGDAGEAAIRGALGRSRARFATTYRKLSEEERARPDGGGRELAVRVEAQVDRGAVEAALQRAGLLASRGVPAAVPAAENGLLVIEPVPSWPALEAFRKRLVEVGAAAATLERVEPGRVRLRLVGGRSAETLARAASQAPPPGVRVELAGSEDGVPRVRLEEMPTEPGPTAAPGAAGAPRPIDTPAPKR